MEGLPKKENLYPYGGITYSGGNGGNNNGGGNGDNYIGKYGGGGSNNPRERFRKKPQKILFTKKKGIPLKAFNTKRSINGGNRRTF